MEGAGCEPFNMPHLCSVFIDFFGSFHPLFLYISKTANLSDKNKNRPLAHEIILPAGVRQCNI